MRTLNLSPGALLVTLIAATFSLEASAQASLTWVSTTGTDSGTCPRTAPCRTFNYAQGQTVAGGEVAAADSGAYSAVTITKAITLFAPPGVHAVISPGSAFAAVDIYAGAADAVTLRNLNIVSNNPSSQYGVALNSGGELTVDGCRVSGFNGNGVAVQSISTATRLYVRNSIIRNNSNVGIKVMASSGVVRANVEGTTLEKNGFGVMALSNAEVTVRDSTASNNVNNGFDTSNTTARMMLENCVASGNTYGLASNSGTIRASSTVVVHNTTGLLPAFGQLISFGNNRVQGNGTNGAFSSNVGLQ
ncbi:right-handed parallel beta-helix repeat-containing protein [Pyxidicoccus sp. 3LFB2]